jgi:hypothetical protein
MKKAFILTALLIFLILIPLASAGIESYKITSEVKGLNVENYIEIFYYNDNFQEMNSGSLRLSANTEIYTVADSYGELDFKFEDSVLYFNFSNPIQALERRTITIITEKSDSVSDKGEYFEYLLVLVPEEDIDDFELLLKLPRDSELYVPKLKLAPLIVPEAEINVREDQITINWKLSIEANDPTVFLARFKQPKNDWLYYILIGIACLALGFIIGTLIQKSFVKAKKKATIDRLKILNKREQDVLELIILNPGIRQNEIKHQLGYTKSSLSKITKKLISRGLIEKHKIGKINKLYQGPKLSGKTGQKEE